MRPPLGHCVRYATLAGAAMCAGSLASCAPPISPFEEGLRITVPADSIVSDTWPGSPIFPLSDPNELLLQSRKFGDLATVFRSSPNSELRFDLNAFETGASFNAATSPLYVESPQLLGGGSPVATLTGDGGSIISFPALADGLEDWSERLENIQEEFEEVSAKVAMQEATLELQAPAIRAIQELTGTTPLEQWVRAVASFGGGSLVTVAFFAIGHFGRKRCPTCHEFIRKEAIKCHFCKSELEANWGLPTSDDGSPPKT